jgi:hypothetical protein
LMSSLDMNMAPTAPSVHAITGGKGSMIFVRVARREPPRGADSRIPSYSP